MHRKEGARNPEVRLGGKGRSGEGWECGGAAKGGRRARKDGEEGVTPISESNAAIREAARLLYHFPSFWRCVYLPEGVVLWIHPPTPTAAPGQAAHPTSPLRPPGEERQSERGASSTPTLWLWRFHTSFIPSLCWVFVLRQSSSGSLSSGKERMGRGKNRRAWGRGESLALLRWLWKMNHGGLHRGRSRGETHLVRKKKQKNRTERRAHVHFLQDNSEESSVCLKLWD